LEKIYASPKGHWQLPIKMNHSHGIKVGNMVFVGGQAAFDEQGNVVHPGDLVKQSRVAMDNLKAVLEELGATLNDVVMLNTFYTGKLTVEEWASSAKVRYSYFKGRGPTGTAIRVGEELNIPGLRVEINAIAIIG
jgi:enamine deaminase RidA (YjgF/YER057c/UK114 family)